MLQPDQAPYEEPRTNRENQRQRDLRDDQRALEASSRARRARSLPLAQRIRRLVAGQLKRRRNAEQQTGPNRNERSEAEYPPVHSDFGKARNDRCGERQQHSREADSKQNAKDAAGTAQQGRFGQQLLRQTSPARAKRD